MENENNSFENQNVSSDSNSTTNNTSNYTYGTTNTNTTNGTNFYAPSGEAPEPRKKKWPIFAAVGGAVAVAGGAAAAYFLFFRTPSFQTPTEAITSCISQLDEQFSAKELGINTLDEKLDSEAFLSAIGEKGAQMEMSLTFENSSVDELSIAEGANIGFTFSNDIKNSRTAASISASFLGIGGDIGFYNDKDMIALTSDEFLPDANLSLNKTDFLDTLRSSMDEDELDAISAMFDQQSSQIASGLTDFSDYALKQLPDSMVSFAKDWEIKENTKKDSIKIDRKDYECFTYEVSITGEAFQGFVEDYCSYLADYDFDKNGFFTMLQESANESGEDIDISDTIKKGLEDLADEIDPSSDDTLDFIMYVSPKGKMLGADFDLTDDSNDSMKLELRFGGDNPGQDIYVNFEEDINGTSLGYDLSCKRTVDDDVETTDYDLSMKVDGDELLAMNGSSSYNTDDDTIESSINATLNDNSDLLNLTFEMEGKYEEINKGTGYKLSFDTLSMSIDSDDITGSVEFSGDISFGVCDGSIKKPSGTSYDMLSMSDADLDSLLETLKKSSTLSMILNDITAEDMKELFEDALGNVEEGLNTYGDQNLNGLLGDEELDKLFGGNRSSEDDYLNDDDSTSEDTQAPSSADNPIGDSSDTSGILEEYMNSSEMASILEDLQSMIDGTGISIDIIGEGNVLTYVYTYNNFENEPGLKEELEDGLDAQASTFEITARSIGNEIGMDNLIIRVQFVDKNGTVICERDFSAN